MNSSAAVKTEDATTILVKPDPSTPALKVLGPTEIAIKAGVTFGDNSFGDDVLFPLPGNGLVSGTDYAAVVTPAGLRLIRLTSADVSDSIIVGGFHFAPGGNAIARAGGDSIPAINPYSVWDKRFMPACADPRGMAYIDTARVPFWADIYLLNVDHLMNGTSKLGETIADGDSPPQNPAGGTFDGLDYETAMAVMKHHGKGLLSIEEFFAAAFGVTEKTVHDGDPKTTQLDAPRTSKFGLMQATGNLWVWGHDGDPDNPRPSLFGGCWWAVGYAGSRQADVDNWAGDSRENVGARGRSDHLQLV